MFSIVHEDLYGHTCVIDNIFESTHVPVDGLFRQLRDLLLFLDLLLCCLLSVILLLEWFLWLEELGEGFSEDLTLFEGALVKLEFAVAFSFFSLAFRFFGWINSVELWLMMVWQLTAYSGLQVILG